ncbi:hypothetical protein [Caldithrix abyssi]|uniref:hypothetical protein n=1 Tax=Caldithrix abyssi TaxID=187145 RepID=UPI0012372111|nr:hypothetical protein [Caldithrix abyssi]
MFHFETAEPFVSTPAYFIDFKLISPIFTSRSKHFVSHANQPDSFYLLQKQQLKNDIKIGTQIATMFVKI